MCIYFLKISIDWSTFVSINSKHDTDNDDSVVFYGGNNNDDTTVDICISPDIHDDDKDNNNIDTNDIDNAFTSIMMNHKESFENDDVVVGNIDKNTNNDGVADNSDSVTNDKYNYDNVATNDTTNIPNGKF